MTEFERQLKVALEALVPPPDRDRLGRVMTDVRATRQRRGLVALAGSRLVVAPWARIAAVAGVAAVGVLVGIAIGSSGWLRVGVAPTPSPTPQASHSSDASVLPSESESAAESPPPASVYAQWERADLPDAAPSVYGGGTPTSVVAFNGGYVAVGTINAACCADGDPALNSGLIWTSANGRDWEMHAGLAVFEHASLHQVFVSGSRLLVYGGVAGPWTDGPGQSVPTVWVSDDALHWTIESSAVPMLVAARGAGFVGVTVRVAEDGEAIRSVFSTSSDGINWAAAADMPPGAVEGLVVGLDGRVLAFGPMNGPARSDGSLTTDVRAWTSPDGISWTGPQIVQREAWFSSVAALPGGFVALGYVEGQQADGNISSSGAVWTSVDGDQWDRQEIGVTIEENLSRIFVVPGALIATGNTYPGGGMANAMVWVSASGGLTWGRVADQPAFAGVNNEVVSIIGTSDGGILAVGWRWDTATSHPLPTVWLAFP